MSYLVTGGTGFIGSYIVRDLVQKGESVVAYDIAPNRNLVDYIVEKKKHHLFEVVQGDINDPTNLIHTCKKFNVERVIHMAAILDSENPILTTRVNCLGTLNVMEACRISGIKKVVLPSTSAVFGPSEMYKDGFIPNNGPYYPPSIYGASKVFDEVSSRHYYREYGLDAVVIRFTHVYGFGRIRGIGRTFDDGLFIYPAKGKPGIVAYSDSIHNWLYVEDAARSMILASSISMTNNRIFTATGDTRSTHEVATLVKNIIPGANITLMPGSMGRAGEKYDTVPIREELGFQAKWSIETAIKRIIEYVRGSPYEIAPYVS